MDASPATAPRAFPLDGRLAAAGETPRANRITDRTASPRLGLRGPGVPGWCAATGIPFPDIINRCESCAVGRVARLGHTEILILPNTGADALPGLATAPGVYDAYREETWAWFGVSGPDAAEALSRLTSADLRASRIREGDVVQTRLAGLDAILIEAGHDRDFDVFTDIASSEFLAGMFRETCPEFDLCHDA